MWSTILVLEGHTWVTNQLSNELTRVCQDTFRKNFVMKVTKSLLQLNTRESYDS